METTKNLLSGSPRMARLSSAFSNDSTISFLPPVVIKLTVLMSLLWSSSRAGGRFGT